MVTTSFKEPSMALIWPPQWIPQPFTFENYTRLFVGRTANVLPFPIFFLNSFYIAVVVVLGRLIVCSAGGFAFARLRFPGRDAAFAMLIGALLLPPVVMLIPLYSLYLTIGWIDTHFPLLIPPIVASTFGTFLFRQFFMTLPPELDDAARIDGASYGQIFWRIALPLGAPVAAVLAIFTFQESWNNFQTAIIYINTLRKQTLPVGLQAFNQQFATEYTVLMAGSVLALLPILFLFIAFQRYFIQGIQFTGLRG
jgi:multiple sugar transport system permease protein